MLPSSRALAASSGLGRNTVSQVYALLQAEGLVQVRAGARGIVCAPRSGRCPVATPPSTRLAAEVHARMTDWPPVHPPDPAGRGYQPGVPDDRGFPHAIWRRMAARVARDRARLPVAYPPVQGLPELRAAIARHVAQTRAVACTAADVVVTQGAQQAFDLLARLLIEPGRTLVALEHPGYRQVEAVCVAAGAQLARIPVDVHGMQVTGIPPAARLIWVTPSHQAPLGVTLSLERRLALLAHAQRHDALIVEDDYDSDFRYGAAPLDALHSLDREGRVCYVGTFSKSLFPDLRVGFLVCPPALRPALLALKQIVDGGSPTEVQATLARFIDEGHLARHLRRMTRRYASRRARLLQALEGPLSRWLRPLPGTAGLHLAAWVRPPAEAGQVLRLACQYLPGAQAVWTPDALPALWLGYGAVDEQRLADDLQALSQALQSC